MTGSRLDLPASHETTETTQRDGHPKRRIGKRLDYPLEPHEQIRRLRHTFRY